MYKVATVILILVLALAVYGFATKKSDKPNAVSTIPTITVSNTPASALPTSKSSSASATLTPTTMKDVNKLVIEDIKVGTGEAALAGKKITVNYRGTLTNGTEFDSSYKRNEPFSFTLGAGEVIQGWDQGFAGMKVGGKRKLMIPAAMGYGARATGAIPANSTLIFDVELLSVE